MNLINALKKGLSRTRESLNIGGLLRRKDRLDEEFIEELEEILYQGDLGVEVTEGLIQSLRSHLGGNGDESIARNILQQEMVKLFVQPAREEIVVKPEVILLVGVNGCGKTTTAGKLAHRYVRRGKRVVLAAADTFRAAAIEQLEKWGERSGARVVRQVQGADSASVAFDAVKSACAKGEDVVIVDTAGRLHSKTNLMEELAKINRVLKKIDDGAPHQSLLVLDAVIGQNSIAQAKVFKEKVGITGLIITKLDGTAKGGAAFAVSRQFGLPIEYIGVGEGVEDLLEFDAEVFVAGLLE